MNVFFSAPFTKEFDAERREYRDRRYRELLESVVTDLERRGHRVLLMQREEGWGAQVGTDGPQTETDYQSIRDWSEVVLCHPMRCDSVGTLIEIGWASALGKPLVLIEDPELQFPSYLRALERITRVRIVSRATGEQFLHSLAEAISDVGKDPAVRTT